MEKKKILFTVGVRSLMEAEFFFSKGADEVYCGIPIIPNHGIKKENFTSKEEIIKTIKLARKLNKRVLIVANDIFPHSKFGEAINYLKELLDQGAHGVIIRDIAVLDYFKKKQIKTYFSLSTLSLCFNSSALKFFVDKGISRIVLPQHMSPREAEAIFKMKPSIEIEIFCYPVFYEVNINSMCSLKCPCSMEIVNKKKSIPYTCHSEFKTNRGDTFIMPMPSNNYLLGIFYDFCKMGVDYVKIARGPNIREVIELYETTFYLTKLVEKGLSKKLFLAEGKKVIKNRQNYGKEYIYTSLSA